MRLECNSRKAILNKIDLIRGSEKFSIGDHEPTNKVSDVRPYGGLNKAAESCGMHTVDNGGRLWGRRPMFSSGHKGLK